MIRDIDREKETISNQIVYQQKNIKIMDKYIYNERIAQIWKYTNEKFEIDLINVDKINNKLFKNRKFITMNESKEKKIINRKNFMLFFIRQMSETLYLEM